MFQGFALKSGLLIDLSDNEYPTQVYGCDNSDLILNGGTHYGFVTRGNPLLRVSHADGTDTYIGLHPGQFFVAAGEAFLSGENARAQVITRIGYAGLFQVGGPIETWGRLCYIDGCSDTLLVCPPVIGEPCLNHLHIPGGTDQTSHTHPSSRIGVILRGSGECRTPEGVFPLFPGMGWYIPAGQVHSFHTKPNEFLDVIAWHPDSDFGPAHTNHPMVNRTYVGGTSAREIEAIQTKAVPTHA